MSYLKKFETFINTEKGDLLVKKLDAWTIPEEPYKRELTSGEQILMRKNFLNYSWSNFIDNKGRIILGGGEEEGGMRYIDEEDLRRLKHLREALSPINNDNYNLKVGSVIIYRGSRATVTEVGDTIFKVKNSKGSEYSINYNQFKEDGARIVS